MLVISVQINHFSQTKASQTQHIYKHTHFMAFHFTHLLDFYSQMFESLFFRQRFMSKMRNDGKSSRTIQFQYKFCVVILAPVSPMKLAFLLENVRACVCVCIGTVNMHAFTKVDQNLGQAYLMQCAYRANEHFRVSRQTPVCACVSVCLHTITLIILHSKKILIDDTSCQNVCTIHLNSICNQRNSEFTRDARQRVSLGSDHTKLHYISIWPNTLTHTAFI